MTYTPVNAPDPGAAIGGAGGSTVRAFPIAYNTPNLLTGAPLFTPAVGDILYDAWFEIDTAWNGTTPQLDFGTAALMAVGNGFFQNVGYSPIALDGFADAGIGGALLFGGSELTVQSMQNNAGKLGHRYVPAKFTLADPLVVVVSRDPTASFPAVSPGATHGAGRLYIVTVTPE